MSESKTTLLNFPDTKANILKFGQLLNHLDEDTPFYGKLTDAELRHLVIELGLFWHDLRKGWDSENSGNRI